MNLSVVSYTVPIFKDNTLIGVAGILCYYIGTTLVAQLGE